jgi:cysteine synthase
MIGRIIGFPVEIVIPDNASTERKTRLLAHGARLIFTDAIQGSEDSPTERHARGPVSRGTGGAGRRRSPPGLDPERGRP